MNPVIFCPLPQENFLFDSDRQRSFRFTVTYFWTKMQDKLQDIERVVQSFVTFLFQMVDQKKKTN